ncbi:hypothetical protein LCGC14_2682540 [marine sediment metagenome]|uniref:Uncharacterized protein n=1 Tax=marine sediment metagenome TaxID=412755 RepID=A0A0F9BVR1_9ZZZZ
MPLEIPPKVAQYTGKEPPEETAAEKQKREKRERYNRLITEGTLVERTAWGDIYEYQGQKFTLTQNRLTGEIDIQSGGVTFKEARPGKAAIPFKGRPERLGPTRAEALATTTQRETQVRAEQEGRQAVAAWGAGAVPGRGTREIASGWIGQWAASRGLPVLPPAGWSPPGYELPLAFGGRGTGPIEQRQRQWDLPWPESVAPQWGRERPFARAEMFPPTPPSVSRVTGIPAGAPLTGVQPRVLSWREAQMMAPAEQKQLTDYLNWLPEGDAQSYWGKVARKGVRTAPERYRTRRQ